MRFSALLSFYFFLSTHALAMSDCSTQGQFISEEQCSNLAKDKSCQVVKIRADFPNGAFSLGVGTVFHTEGDKTKYILTPAHVSSQASKLRAACGDAELALSLVAESPSYDLSVLRVDDQSTPLISPALTIGKNLGSLPDDFSVLRYSLGDGLQRAGSALFETEERTFFLRKIYYDLTNHFDIAGMDSQSPIPMLLDHAGTANTGTQPGMSGMPIFASRNSFDFDLKNDFQALQYKDTKLLGIVAKTLVLSSTTLFIPGDIIYPAVDSLLKGNDPSEAGMRLHYSWNADKARRERSVTLFDQRYTEFCAEAGWSDAGNWHDGGSGKTIGTEKFLQGELNAIYFHQRSCANPHLVDSKGQNVYGVTLPNQETRKLEDLDDLIALHHELGSLALAQSLKTSAITDAKDISPKLCQMVQTLAKDAYVGFEVLSFSPQSGLRSQSTRRERNDNSFGGNPLRLSCRGSDLNLQYDGGIENLNLSLRWGKTVVIQRNDWKSDLSSTRLDAWGASGPNFQVSADPRQKSFTVDLFDEKFSHLESIRFYLDANKLRERP